MYGSPPIKSLEKHKWNIRIVRAKINSEKIELVEYEALPRLRQTLARIFGNPQRTKVGQQLIRTFLSMS